MDDFHAMPGHLIRRAQQISTALFAEECSAFDLTAVQFAALMAIRAHPKIDATRLSAQIAFDRSTLGDVLERLEAKGWVARSSSKTDKRVKLLRLSAAGEQLLRRALPAVRRVQERLLSPLEPQDREKMIALLSRLAQMHGDAAPAPGDQNS
jgi:MarR family transcriptional regulator, lower aerobic nicotinate degradation pathway regulator